MHAKVYDNKCFSQHCQTKRFANSLSRASVRAHRRPLAHDRSAKVYSLRAPAALFEHPHHITCMPRYVTTSVSAGIVKLKGLLAF
jgi:hypothetical protein